MSDTKTMPGKVQKSETEWRKELTPMQYAVLREKATEQAILRRIRARSHAGNFTLRRVRTDVVRVRRQFDSGCGWPSFTQPALEKTDVIGTQRQAMA